MVSAPALANPTGGQVSTGAATITSSGNNTAVKQTSEGVVINWSSFDIGNGQTTQFYQPNAQAIAVNRIGSKNASQILGTLDANGNVVLINSNGLLFGKNARVNVGSLVATSTDGTDSDLLSGKFTKAGSQSATIVNHGVITVGTGGTVALVAPNVTNTGIVNAKLGTVSLGAANKFTVDLNGDGLVSFAAQGDVNGKASVINKGRLVGANVSMTAHAAEGIATGVVNTSGVIVAQGAHEVGGTIVLDAGDAGAIDISGGKLEAKGPKGGGTITVGSWSDQSVTVNSGATLNASATKTGNGGHIQVISNTTNFAGTAQAQGGILSGNGGLIETSGHTLDFLGSSINASSAHGKAGMWLLDPDDLTIKSADAAEISSTLGSSGSGTNVSLQTTSSGCSGGFGTCASGSGDIDIEGVISWGSSATLSLDAYHSVNVLAPISITGAGSLALQYNDAATDGALSFGLTSSGFTGNVNYSTGTGEGIAGQSLAITTGGVTTDYTLLYSRTDVQNINTSAGGNSALADSIDASGGDFIPISTPYLGTFEGLGNTISNLTINVSTGNAGLFTQLGQSGSGGGAIRDLGLQGVSITGDLPDDSFLAVGGLAGASYGTIANSYVTGAVSSSGAAVYVGGLVGQNLGSIGGSFAAASVNAGGNSDFIGGLVGYQQGTVSDSFATGTVSGTGGNSDVGGLIGYNGGTTSASYATGAVSAVTNGNGNYIGGLVGVNAASIANSYATGSVTGIGDVDIDGGLVGDNTGTISASYATGIVNIDFFGGGLIGEDDNEGGVTSSYWDMQTSGIGASQGAGNISNDTGITGLTTSTLQAALPSGFSSSTWSILPGTSYPYLSWQFTGTPEVLSGYAYNGHGTSALGGGAVTLDVYGNTIAALTTGADGYFYDIIPAGTIATGEALLAYTTGANNGAHVESFSGNGTGFDIWGNTLIAPTSDTLYSTASGTSLQTQDYNLISDAVGPDSNAAFVTGLSNFGYVGTGASFTVDQSLSPANGLFVETRNGNLMVADPITIAGANGLTLYSSADLNIDAPVNVTGSGAVALAYNSSSPTNLGLDLTSNSFGGSIKYGSTDNGGTLTIEGTNYTLLYSMSDVQNIASSGNFALATSQDASTYSGWTPVSFSSGTFEGLGNTISNLTIDEPSGGLVGLFGSSGGTIRDIGIVGGSVTGHIAVGSLAATNTGTILDAFSSAAVFGTDNGFLFGGLVGASSGAIVDSYATGSVTGGNDTYNIGGLVGSNSGSLVETYAAGTVTAGSGSHMIGGLVGANNDPILVSYATGAVIAPGDSEVGGLVGYDISIMSGSYSSGFVSAAGGTNVGGFVGEDNTSGHLVTNDYWDMDTSGIGASAGAGNTSNDSGITGMHTSALQGALPSGFSNANWGTGTGLYPYFLWQYPSGTPQKIDGYAYTDAGVTADAGDTVAALMNGNALTSGSGASIGADGYYYILLAPGTISGANQVLATSSLGAALVENAGGSVSNVNIYGGALNDLTQASSYFAAKSGYVANLATAEGSNTSVANFVAGLSGYDVSSSAANFTLDASADTSTSDAIIADPTGNITVTAAQSWSNGNSLTLDAGGALTIDAPITISGGGGLALDAGYDNTTVPGTPLLELSFGLTSAGFTGSVNYGSTNNGGALTINGTPYTLLYSMSDLDSLACSNDPGKCVNPNAENLAGNYALASSVDASGFGYVPIGDEDGVPGDEFSGMFEGLGHTISNLSAHDLNPPAAQGLFSGTSGTIRDIGMVGGSLGFSGNTGFLAGFDTGVIENTFETGTVVSSNESDPSTFTGGLVGLATSTAVIVNSFAAGQISKVTSNAGGLVGDLQGTLVNDYATISVVAQFGGGSELGGLVGEADSGSRIENSYATGAVGLAGSTKIGGLVGLAGGTIIDSYSTGYVTGSSDVGGLLGEDSGATITDSYWNMSTSGMGATAGAGNVASVSGTTGETTSALQGTLPTGFSSGIWSTASGLYPYLTWQYPSGTPQVLTGMAYKTGGAAADAGDTVTASINGNALLTNSGASAGANGYYYILVAPGTISTDSAVALYTSTGARVEAVNGSTGGLDIWDGALIAPTSDTTYSTANATSLQTQDASLISSAVGSNTSLQTEIAGLSNYGYLASGSSFTIDEPLTLSNGLYVEMTGSNAGITIADALTLPGSTALELDASGALAIDAPVSVTGGGRVALTAAHDTTTVPGTSLLELSFDLGSNGFAGNVNYAVGTGEGISGQSLSIDGTAYTLLYSLTDVHNIASSGKFALADTFNAGGTTYTDSPTGANNTFSGTFEGLGNAIDNLKISNSGYFNQYLGLFAQLSGTVENLMLANVDLSITGLGGDDGSVGAIAGESTGILRNVAVTGVVDGNMSGGNTGMLVGAMDNGTIVGSLSTGSVTGGNTRVGGLVGSMGSGTIDTSFSTAEAESDGGAGGLSGQALSGSRIENSYATGAVDASGGNNVGGLVGYLGGTISGSFATGAVTGSNNVGGLVGESEEGAISNSYAMGAVSGSTGVGGLVGALLDPSSSVTDSFSTGRVTGSSHVGGLVGEQSDSGGVTDSYWDTQTSGQSTDNAGATPEMTAGLQGSLPTGFSSAVWGTGSGLYPYLLWQFPSGTPQAISGKVFSGSTSLAGENVGLLIDGSAVSPAITAGSGANGYYYLLLAPGTISASGSDVVTYLTSGTPANTFMQGATGSHGDVDLFENTFVAASGSPDSAAILAELPTALGSASGPQFLYTASSGVVPGVNLVIVDTASAFTLDSSLEVGDAILELYTTGSDTQTSGTITANQLITVSTGGLSLDQANAIANLGSVSNSGAGGISVADAQALTIAGNLSTGTDDITLTTTGAGNGIAIDNHLVGGTIDLVSAGTIRENGTNGFIHASVLEGSSDGLAFFNEANKIGEIGDFSTGGAGAFSLYDWETLDVTGQLNTGKHSITLDTQIGDTEIGGTLSGGTISLTSVGGEVDGTGIIDANVLNASANTGIDLDGTNNDIKSVGTDTTNSGPNTINKS